MADFVEFPKISRLMRDVIVTEKLDGTNAQVYIRPASELPNGAPLNEPIIAVVDGMLIYAGSRTKWLTPTKGDDNYGFAVWVLAHGRELAALGPGRHFGEWWGGGIQRGYGLSKDDKRFSLFNVARWGHVRDRDKYPVDMPECCYVVPVLYTGSLCSCMGHIDDIMDNLITHGSYAASGYMNPEGVVVYSAAGGWSMKRTINKDDEPKGIRR